jgi:hypothetical protein
MAVPWMRKPHWGNTCAFNASPGHELIEAQSEMLAVS